jgi:predicted DNA-binding ribbon-helix-helix protein
VRSVRIPDPLWARMQEIARRRDVFVTEVVIDALTRYERRRR